MVRLGSVWFNLVRLGSTWFELAVHLSRMSGNEGCKEGGGGKIILYVRCDHFLCTMVVGGCIDATTQQICVKVVRHVRIQLRVHTLEYLLQQRQG